VKDETQPMIQLGLGKSREIIREFASNLKRTRIMGQGPPLNYAFYIVAENLLLESTPLVIFDSNDYFTGLSISSADAFALREQLVDYEPIGFPTKRFVAKDTLKLSLKDADLFFLLDVLGMKDSEFQKNLALFCFTTQANTPQELISKLAGTKELTDYEKLRAERILQILDKHFASLFGETIPATELSKQISGKLGRAVIIDTKQLSKEEKIVVTHTIMRQITRSSSEMQGINCAVMIPESGLLFAQSQEKTVTAITRLESRGIGVVLGTEKELPEELENTLTAKMSVVSGKDVAVSIKGKRNYRVIMRPNLSGNPKI